MSIQRIENGWTVDIQVIYKKEIIKGPFRDKLRVTGKAKVNTDMDNGFIALDFDYTGSAKENPKRLYDYIRALAVTIQYNNRRKEENTLENHIDGLIENSIL